MAVRDPESKRRQLIEASLVEFAASGIAGARIDRIAKRAGCSAGLVYTYFGSKEELFHAVFTSIIEQAVDEAPLTPHDLLTYAGRLFDNFEDHPEVARFVTWYRLEGGDVSANASAADGSAHKVDVIAAAQRAGTVPSTFDPAELLSLILHLASFWTAPAPELFGLAERRSLDQRRALVVQSVAALLRQ
jgi:AcrR family transcriptional regulator